MTLCLPSIYLIGAEMAPNLFLVPSVALPQYRCLHLMGFGKFGIAKPKENPVRAQDDALRWICCWIGGFSNPNFYQSPLAVMTSPDATSLSENFSHTPPPAGDLERP